MYESYMIGAIGRIKLLGGFCALDSHGKAMRFRSRTVEHMLAYLILNNGHETPRYVIEELFWPESDAFKQRQNYRKALSDIRLKLGPKDNSTNLFRRSDRTVQISLALLSVDLIEFKKAALHSMQQKNLDQMLDSISYYEGNLWGGLEGSWADRFRDELEEIYCQLVVQTMEVMQNRSLVSESIRVGQAALLKCMTREDIHIALIKSYKAAKLECEAIRQFERLEAVLQDQWGEPPSYEATVALSGS